MFKLINININIYTLLIIQMDLWIYSVLELGDMGGTKYLN